MHPRRDINVTLCIPAYLSVVGTRRVPPIMDSHAPTFNKCIRDLPSPSRTEQLRRFYSGQKHPKLMLPPNGESQQSIEVYEERQPRDHSSTTLPKNTTKPAKQRRSRTDYENQMLANPLCLDADPDCFAGGVWARSPQGT